MTASPHIQMRSSNRSENVAVVREVLDGLATALGLAAELTDDVKTAASEACNNVVLHAYGGDEGPMELDILVHERELELIIRDRGTGIRPHAHWPDGTVHGVGLAVIQAYADRVQFRGSGTEGTEVCMTFGMPEGTPVLPPVPGGGPTPALALDGEVVVAVHGPELLAATLGRVTSSLAVRAMFTTDRLSDAQLVADAVAARASQAAAEQRIVFALDSSRRELELRIGPLRRGAGREFANDARDGVEPAVLHRLCDEVGVEPAPGRGEHVRVRIADTR